MSAELIHFLLVEDDMDHAQLVLREMSRNHIKNTVDHVDDGEKALAYLHNEEPYQDAKRPHVILLDLKLPKKDGHEVLAVIKEDPELRKIPVVVLTTSNAEKDRAKAYGNYVNSYLVKPLEFLQFHEMVQQLKLYWGIWNRTPDVDSDSCSTGEMNSQ